MLEVLIPGCSELQTSDTGLWVQRILCSSEELAVHLATTTPVSACPVCQLDSARPPVSTAVTGARYLICPLLIVPCACNFRSDASSATPLTALAASSPNV